MPNSLGSPLILAAKLVKGRLLASHPSTNLGSLNPILQELHNIVLIVCPGVPSCPCAFAAFGAMLPQSAPGEAQLPASPPGFVLRKA